MREEVVLSGGAGSTSYSEEPAAVAQLQTLNYDERADVLSGTSRVLAGGSTAAGVTHVQNS